MIAGHAGAAGLVQESDVLVLSALNRQAAVVTTAVTTARTTPWWRHPLLVLGAVAVAGTVTRLLAGHLEATFSWDETIYVSQFARRVPPAVFSPHRSIGTALLIAPVAVFTNAVVPIREYLNVLAGAGLFLAYWPWLKIRPGYAVPLAAALFSSLWLSLFYGVRAMPNVFVAYCLVAGVALALRAGQAKAGPLLAGGLAAVIAVATLLRPLDATLAAAAIAAGVLILRLFGRQPRAWRTLAAITFGLAAGWGQWLVEAYARFGGPAARLRATAMQNATGLYWSEPLRQLRTLRGETACKPGTDCGKAPLSAVVWWSAAAVLIVVAVVVAARRRRLRATWALTLAVAFAVAIPYMFLTLYATPRYLLPSYALAALPVAAGLATLPAAVAARVPRMVLVVALSVAVAAQVGSEFWLYNHHSVKSAADRFADGKFADRLAALGVRPPCLLWGARAPTVAYALKCSNWDLISRQYTRPELIRRLAAAATNGRTVAVVLTRPPPANLRPGWNVRPMWRHRHWWVMIRGQPAS